MAQSGRTEDVIADNVAFLRSIQAESGIEMYVGGLMGCRGDAYTGEGRLSEEAARTFHQWTVERFADAGVDFLYAGIMPALSEAAGLARAADASGIPYIISFAIQQDGTLIVCLSASVPCFCQLGAKRKMVSGSPEYRAPTGSCRPLWPRRRCRGSTWTNCFSWIHEARTAPEMFYERLRGRPLPPARLFLPFSPGIFPIALVRTRH